MTSDAKVGLLLGLVFIFVIAFVINGLPRFRNAANSNELTTTMVSSQKDTFGIGTKERKAQDVVNWAEQIREQSVREQPIEEVQPTLENDESVRFEMQLPQYTSAVGDTPTVEVEIVDQLAPIASTPIPDEITEVTKPEPVKSKKRTRSAKPASAKTYVVNEGDNLADIAKKFYGALQGNKRANIMRIFQANRALLRSVDEIRVGQKLTIPPLPASAMSKDKTGGSFAGALFEKAVSIGRKRPSAGRDKGPGGQYVVKEGDSLWLIAAEHLGDPSRYKEISKLNAQILDDEDRLTVGLSLRMPVR